jgi:hypothetical protein
MIRFLILINGSQCSSLRYWSFDFRPAAIVDLYKKLQDRQCYCYIEAIPGDHGWRVDARQKATPLGTDQAVHERTLLATSVIPPNGASHPQMKAGPIVDQLISDAYAALSGEPSDPDHQ